MATLTVNPATGSGGTTMDGAMANGYAVSWASARSTVQGDGVGSTWDPTATNNRIRGLQNGSGFYMGRGGMTFDTSSLTAAANISSAVLSVFGTSTNFVNADLTSLVPVSFNPANKGTFVDSDWTTVVYSACATAINFASLSQSAYNDFTLNATGISNISKTGITSFAFITGLDLNNTGPAVSGNDNIFEYLSADGASKPKLVITYTLGGGSNFLTLGVGT